MGDFVERYGPWVLVTGAGNGLGAEFARQLAARQLNVVIVDVDATGLDAVATELRGALDGLANGPVQVAGRGNAWSAALLSRLLPRKWAVKLVSATTRD